MNEETKKELMEEAYSCIAAELKARKKKEASKRTLEELEGIKGNDNVIRMYFAYKLTSYLKAFGKAYDLMGPLTSSAIAYELGMHNVDVDEYDIDPRMCHGPRYDNPFVIEIGIDGDIHRQTLDYVRDELFKETCHNEFCRGAVYKKEVMRVNRFCYPLNGSLSSLALELPRLIDDKTALCFDEDFVRGHKKDFVIIHITPTMGLRTIDGMREKLHEDRTYSNDVSALNELVKKKCLSAYYIREAKALGIDGDITFLGLLGLLAKKKAIFEEGDNRDLTTRDDVYHSLKGCMGEEKAMERALRCRLDLKDEKAVADLKEADELRNLIYVWRKSDLVALAQRICLAAELCLKDPEGYYESIILEGGYSDEDGTVNPPIIEWSKASMEMRRWVLELLEEYQTLLVDRCVGPFFFIDGHIIGLAEPTREHDMSTRFINSDVGHFDLFRMICKPGMKEEYSMYPRGRVIYDAESKSYKVYADKAILRSKAKREEIKRLYRLGKFNVAFEGDEHYKTLDY